MTGILLLASCAQTHENAEQVDHLPNMYPDYADVTIPVNIAPLNFEIRDKNLTNIETTLTIEGADANDAANTLTATSNGQNLKFDMDDWKASGLTSSPRIDLCSCSNQYLFLCKLSGNIKYVSISHDQNTSALRLPLFVE